MNEYEKYLEQAKEFHKNPNNWPGKSLKPHLKEINKIFHIKVLQKGEAKVLNYGCGKAKFEPKEWNAFRYDPAIPEYENKPKEKFDIVVCTDVMEHIPAENVPSVLRDIFSFKNPAGIAFFSICVRPAWNKLPNGQQAHATVLPPVWWKKQFDKYTKYIIRFNGLNYWNDITLL